LPHVRGIQTLRVKRRITKMKDNIQMKGHVNAVLFDENGSIKQTLDTDNLVVTVGKEWIIDRIGTNTPATASWIVIGAGSTPADAGDTNIESRLAGANGTVTQPTATQHQVVTTFGATVGTGTVTEYALFGSGSAMIGRIVTGSVAKGAADSLQVTYVLSVS
jgi:hypothetical protein